MKILPRSDEIECIQGGKAVNCIENSNVDKYSWSGSKRRGKLTSQEVSVPE